MKKQPLALCVLLALLGLLTTLILAACGDATSTPAASSGKATTAASNTSIIEPATNNPSATTAATSAAATTVAAATTAAGGSASRPGGSGSVVAGGEAALPTADASSARMTTAATTAATSATTAAASSSGAGNYAVPPAQPPVNQDPLRAGQVDDNLKFDEYLQYLRAYRDAPVLPFDVTERYIIQVMDANARTVANSTVKVYSGQTLLFVGKTYSNGQLLFFPRANQQAAQANQFEVVADKDGHNASQTFKRVAPGQSQSSNSGGAVWTMSLPGSLRPALEQSPNLDLLFLVDSTGSMGGEIRQIQSTISDISNQIVTLPGSPRVRFGAVTYRDRGDSYVTRKFGFTASLADFSSFLNTISAGGGGDYPESLNEALHVAVNDMNWDGGEAVRLVFLVADAPPHMDYAQDYKYTDESIQAVRKGIKIYAIGASGLDKQGEYIFRQLAQLSLAQYLFITRGGDEGSPSSGGPASNTNTVYEEKNLDRIVINIVRRELTNLTQ